MYLEHITDAAVEGKFVFMRPSKSGSTPVEVQTDFSNAELTGIFTLTRQDGPWNDFEGLISSVSRIGSGFARELQVDQYATIPTAFGLREKREAVLRMNTMRVVLNMMPMDNPKFVAGVFVQQDPLHASQTVEGLRTELNVLMEQNNWVDEDVFDKLPDGEAIVKFLGRLIEYYNGR